MDSVILYFGQADSDQIEAAVRAFEFNRDGSSETIRSGERYCYFERYSEQEQLAEYEPAEREALVALLGATPRSAFCLSSRHGENARLALEVASGLMQRFQPSVLDDDNGGFWLAQAVSTCLEASTSSDLFTLSHGEVVMSPQISGLRQ